MSTHTEINLETGEVIERPLTVEEEKSIADFVIESEAKRAEYAAKETAKQAILDKLGLTADEAAALLS